LKGYGEGGKLKSAFNFPTTPTAATDEKSVDRSPKPMPIQRLRLAAEEAAEKLQVREISEKLPSAAKAADSFYEP
jgi:hypothetical protein